MVAQSNWIRNQTSNLELQVQNTIVLQVQNTIEGKSFLFKISPQPPMYIIKNFDFSHLSRKSKLQSLCNYQHTIKTSFLCYFLKENRDIVQF